MESNTVQKNTRVGIAIVATSCCFPGSAPFEEQAKRVVEQAIAETGIPSEIRMLPVSSYYQSLPKEIVPKLMADYNQGKISVPPILINGKVVFYGVPGLEAMKAALRQAAEIPNNVIGGIK